MNYKDDNVISVNTFFGLWFLKTVVGITKWSKNIILFLKKLTALK